MKTTGKPIAAVVGFIGKIPVAGMGLYNLHHIVGLQDLGYDVHYIERLNRPSQAYNPVTSAMTDDPSYAVEYLNDLLPRYGISRDRFSFIDRENRCHGSGWKGLHDALDHAEFVLTLEDPTWFDDLERCSRRAFVDGDPMFNQVAMMEGEETRTAVLKHYDTLFTYGTRMGKADCALPACGREWIPTNTAVATRLWDTTPVPGPLPITALMNWASGRDLNWQGKEYGHKNREFERFMDLPRRATQSFVLAIGGNAPREKLEQHGWDLVSALNTTKTIEAYRMYIARSRADFGIAKHAYVASRCGWFSDRSTCFLAAGRPVLHQDTGCGDWLPTGEGVLLFSNVEDVLRGLDELNKNYERHARAARAIAEKYFESTTVIGRMLDQAGFR